MKTPLLVTLLIFFSACATKEIQFDPKKTCSPLALKYLKTNKLRPLLQSTEAIDQMQRTQPGVQACYETFAKRSGIEEFDTCLVVGFDDKGKMDFYELSSMQAKLDNRFLKCANAAIGIVPFWKLGTNYSLLQSYHFYKD